ncbi:MAG: TonB-dependent receptor [Sphingobium sp.]
MTSSRIASFRRRLSGAALIALATSPAALHAQAAQPQAITGDVGLEEIIVTAQRRAENLQEVPIAVAAVSAQALQNAGIDTSRDLPQVVPSVQFTRSGASGLFFVRGVGTTNAAVGEEGANAVYVDGVYLGDLAQTINNFNNIERIEVLKGPQGTLFGRNATGGLIHIITREPGDELTVKGEIGYANYQTASARAHIATPVTDRLGIDLAVTKLHQNKGWGYDATVGREVHVQDYWGARSKLVWKPTDTLKITATADYYKNKDNLGLAWKLENGVLGSAVDQNSDLIADPGFPPTRGPAGQDATSNDYPLTRQKIYGFSLTGELDLDFATLTSITGYRKTRNQSDFDVDGGPYRLIRIGFDSGGKTFQQELRLGSNGHGPLSWQAGVFYLYSEATNDSNFTGLAFEKLGFRSQHIVADLKTDSYAAFAEATYAITPTTKITGGIRYTTDKRKFDGKRAIVSLATGLDGAFTSNPLTTLDYNAWTYRVAIRQEITDDASVYASVNRGFKAGSYSLQSPLNAPYNPQYIMAYEGGLKTEWFDRKLRLNLAVYHYDIDDYQVRSAALGGGASVVLNAATVKVDGVDAEFEVAPVDGVRLFGGATWLNSRFARFGGAGAAYQSPIVYPAYEGQSLATTCPAALRGTRNPGVSFTGTPLGGFYTCFGDVSGNKTPNAPKFTASIGASYTVDVGKDGGSLRLSALYSYNDGYYFEADNIFRQGNYGLLNASIEYRPWEQVGIEIWGRNITDTEYAVQKLTTDTGTTTALGAPATYGVNLKFDF